MNLQCTIAGRLPAILNQIASNCLLTIALIATPSASAFAAEPPAPFGPLPSKEQLKWHQLEYYGFLHFTVNTFTDRQWGAGDESPAVFTPSELDVSQWTRVAKSAGMKGLILTTKHHDGFCLWPSKYTEHSIKHSPYRDGKGDIVRELSKACEEAGLKFGVYLSPWDRNHADYGKPEYIDYYRNQLRELLTNYGDIAELWFDGANGGSGYYGGANEERRIDRESYYKWPETNALALKLQPQVVIFSDAGPGCRWVGNETGHGSSTNWATMRLDGMYPGGTYGDRLTHGDRDGTHWVPSEVDVSIRPSWFYLKQEDDKVKTVEELLEIYYSSIGQGSNLLLNIPPDRRGLIHEIDEQRLTKFHEVIQLTFDDDLARDKRATASNTRGNDEAFGPQQITDGDRETYWATDDEVTEAELTVELGKAIPFDRIRMQEFISLGQRIEKFSIDVRVAGKWQEVGSGNTIGVRRILRLPLVTGDAVRLRIESSRACPTISTLEVYRSPPNLGTTDAGN
ncbi:alpha-L-fucosidase [Adhaeretor mobilis]|uniref:alpha-L-fucosidase n=1 Tax=Adhaeretor mobilis TaxID=1930276 RepID=A0A517MTK6_9BACT|nr:alpha-L-fucosidase [Adhaeretor mobilis]QDS98192.1 Alpha-L-fucosidase [Adhaeretor mobilis]